MFSYSEVPNSVLYLIFIVVQLLSHVQLFVTPSSIAHQAALSVTISHSLFKLMSIESMMPSNHLILFFSCSQSFLASGSFFQGVGSPIRWPNYWSFSFSISPSKEYSGVISFRIDWFDLPVIQRTLKNLLQNHSLKASILRYSTFLMFQWSYPDITNGKTIALTRRIFVGKVVSLLFNTLSRFFLVILPSNKCLLVSWLQSLSAVILEPKEIKSATASNVSLSICLEMMRSDDMILVFRMLSFMTVFSLSFFTLIKRLFSSSYLSAICVVSSVYLRLLIFLLAILIRLCASSSLTFCVMNYANKLNK